MRQFPVYVADFETSHEEGHTWVWAWACMNIQESCPVLGKTLEAFLYYVKETDKMVYFHNIEFDASFILNWLLVEGFQYIHEDPNEWGPRGSFKAVIADFSNKIYEIRVHWANGKKTMFRCSLKKIPLPVAAIGKSFGLDVSKGEIDHSIVRRPGYEPTDEEWDYVARDVIVVAQALKQLIDAGLTHMTIGSDSLAEYKTTQKQFDRLFPLLDEETDGFIRASYKGGWTYCANRYQYTQSHPIIHGKGLVFDVNSLYPWVMEHYPLPYGPAMWHEGDPLYTQGLWVARATILATLKKDHLPCIQIKGDCRYRPTDYVEVIDDPTTITFTSVDWELWNEQYDIEVLAWQGFFTFEAQTGMFSAFVDKWRTAKTTASDPGSRMRAKLFLNNLYGKFGTNTISNRKIPTLDHGVVRFTSGPDETREPVYIPVATFVTAYARRYTVRAAQANYQRFAYADTDSIHLLGWDEPQGITRHDSDFGAWKQELAFDEAIYVRAKCYCEKAEGKFHHHVAGVPQRLLEDKGFEVYTDGYRIPGKLMPKMQHGGRVLLETDFTMSIEE